MLISVPQQTHRIKSINKVTQALTTSYTINDKHYPYSYDRYISTPKALPSRPHWSRLPIKSQIGFI